MRYIITACQFVWLLQVSRMGSYHMGIYSIYLYVWLGGFCYVQFRLMDWWLSRRHYMWLYNTSGSLEHTSIGTGILRGSMRRHEEVWYNAYSKKCVGTWNFYPGILVCGFIYIQHLTELEYPVKWVDPLDYWCIYQWKIKQIRVCLLSQ